MSNGFGMETDINEAFDRLRKKVNAAQNVLTTECKKWADEYTPMDEGMLKNNFAYTENEHGAKDGWTYGEKYAHRQWEGTKEDGDPFTYSLVKNDKSRRRWTDHGAANGKEDILGKVKAELD